MPTYSFSRLNGFSTCQYEYYLNYLAGESEKLEKTENGFGLVGTFCHSLLEDYGNGKLLQFELKDSFLDRFDEEVPDGVKMVLKSGFVKDLTEKYKQDCASFFEKYDGIQGGKQISAEDDFRLLVKIKNKPLILRGIIDAVIQDDDGEYHIYDFKSKSKFKDNEELKEYARQLYFYSLWIYYRYGKFPKTLNFLQFRIDVLTTVKFTNEGLEETLDWIYNRTEEIEAEQLWLPRCLEKSDDTFYQDSLCNYRYSCPYSPHYRGENFE